MKLNRLSNIIVLSALLTGTVFTSCSKKEGCTDPAANNFDIEAEKDDGSCSYDETLPPPTVVEQSTLLFNFTHNFDGLPVSMGNFNQFNYMTANGDTISFTKLKYLISDIKLYTASGDSVVLNGYQLIDLTDGVTLSYAPGVADWGTYAAIGFNFGFDTVDNAGNYVDLNSISWNWPMMIGGGYHNMQLEGKYKFNGADSSYAYHNGTASNMGAHEQNHIRVMLNGIALNEHNVTIEIKMNIAEWFRNPNVWDLNAMHSGLMMNYTAQKLMHENGYNVFSLGSVYQKK